MIFFVENELVIKHTFFKLFEGDTFSQFCLAFLHKYFLKMSYEVSYYKMYIKAVLATKGINVFKCITLINDPDMHLFPCRPL